MRKALFAAAALAPTCLVATTAKATTTISNSRDTPIATSTANNGQPDDIDIASGGSIAVSSTTPAVTLDSNNSVTNSGSISIKDVDNATGVLIEGGNTGNFANTGTITVNESYTPSDTANGDGIVEAPFAKGTGRYGVRLTGTAPFVGSIGNAGSITVQGNNSFGMSLEAPLQGAVTNSGTISVSGDNSVALMETGGVSGNLQVTGGISGTGQNTSAAVLNGAIGGALSIYSTISATGYTTTTRPSDALLGKVQATAADIEQGGPALVIGGDVAHGILLGAAPANTVSGSTADVDGDGIPDGSETSAAVSSFGSAPAMIIGRANRDVNIGVFGGSDGENVPQPANAYGLIVRGAISGSGQYDGVSAQALQIGASGGTVEIAGGVRIVGSVSATSYEANATGIHLLSGATVPEMRVEGTLTATINHSNLSTTAPTSLAQALIIDSGAAVSTLTNLGTISASATGDNMSASAVVDNGGGVTQVTNEGVISAVVTPTVSTDTLTGRTIALDLRANTTGVTLTQQINPSPDEVYGSVSGSDATSTTSVTAVTPTITGDVLMGSGPNTVNLLAGAMTGELDLGSGSASLTIDNGASYSGALLHTGPALTINVVNGALNNLNPNALQATSLNVGSSGNLVFGLDPANNRSAEFIVSGTATLAAGAKIGVSVLSELTSPETFTLISAANLSSAATDSSLLSQVPFLFTADLRTDPAAGTVQVDVQPKTAAELGIRPAETAALGPILTNLGNDPALQSVVYGQTTQAGFAKDYGQLLPDYAGGVFQLALAASDAVSRATSRKSDATETTAGHAAWGEEVVFGVERPSDGLAAGYRGGGFGFLGGLESSGHAIGDLGLTLGFLTGGLKNPDLPGDGQINLTELEGGVYWRAQLGGLLADARVGAGYLWITSQREFLETNSSGATVLDRTSKGNTNGYNLTGRFGLAYQVNLGRFYFRPGGHADFFRLNQGAYTERYGQDSFDLALQSRAGQQASVTGSLVAGYTIGSGSIRWRPEVELGYRDVFTGTAGDTTARFVAGGDSFTLMPAAITGGGPIGRVAVKASGDVFEVGVDAGVEAINKFTEADVKVVARVLF